ncbi:helix-turn-helix domain-containing protein [Dactylosporangium roseum]|uniref:Helix-turn-helix domain-containing protein n=1 Tax=Dactylosporangium roseum TaxID=47989 RepID=A0ABY5Z8Q3_9ACTN|nr:helix-turn-helix domain-containing protein [Dactylosporangium roseum]UWZ37936.1 helix-turn-helix domain-containing protein [Dactylosporangium roseum]
MAAQILHTVAEIAELWRVSKRFVYDEIHAGNLAAVDLSRSGEQGKLRVPESVADAYWADKFKVQPTQLRIVA